MICKRLCLFLIFLFSTQFVQGQLSNFTLNVTKTDETCTANGTLTFSVTNTTPGSVILYSIYLTSNLSTPISVQSATSISGLTAGTYRVIATQSLGNQTGSQQQDISITDLVRHLVYQINGTNEVCGNDGKITVNVTRGTPVDYEIFSGPMTRPLQSSNVFTGLTAGVYQVRVFDNCREGIVQTFTLLRANTALAIDSFTPYLASCTSVNVGFEFESVVDAPLGVVKFPIQVVTTLFPPSGPSIVYNQTINNGSIFAQSVPFYTNQPYNYSMVITDGCGTSYNVSGVIQNLSVAATYTLLPQDCTHKQATFFNVSGLTLVSAPAGFGGTLPLNLTPTIVNNSTHLGNLTAGNYVFNAIDICGNPQVFTIVVVIVEIAPPFTLVYNVNCTNGNLLIYEISQLTMTSAPSTYGVSLPHDYTSLINSANYAAFVQLPVGTYVFDALDRCGSPHVLTVILLPTSQSPVADVLEGCENGFGSVQITGQLVSISLTSAPTAYGATLPVNLTASVTNGNKLTLDMLPPGNYIFQSTNSCNIPYTTNVTILGYQESTSAIIIPNCGSFNINLNHSSNNNELATFWLQKYNPLTTSWGHPLTNVVYPDTTVPYALNSFELTNNAINYNLAYSGQFRILKVFNSYSNGNPSAVDCFKVITTFDFSDGPKINSVYSISCGATFEVVVNAEGNSALTYRITSKNGQAFLIENGNSSIFSGLAPAIYNFQVEDECHNTVPSLFEVLNPNPMMITATPVFCNGQPASLTAPNFPFLSYQWWKDNNTTTILSTANSLNFASFNSVVNNGTYHVRISYAGNPNSCLNQVLNYTLLVDNPVPNAGNDNSVSYCGRQGNIDLSGLLTGNFATTGTWTEITTSNMLTNNLWNSTNVAFGTYKFKYGVTGVCNQSDEALINITIKEIPDIPIASVDPISCATQNLNLFATDVANATYHWVGPNGFVSTSQNPILNSVSENENGIYTVYSSLNGCQSGNSDVIVEVSPLPLFALNQDCVGGQYQVWITKLNGASYDDTLSAFNWAGPNNFTSTDSVITITGSQTGTYSLTITNENGCDATNTIDVQRTTCFIPNVITPNNDGANESLNLTGFDVTKLEIYNRWGRKVYEKNNYLDEWHGQNMNGGLLPDSTYYYVIKLGDEETKTGWILISRE